MSTIINGTSSAITFPDSSVQNTSAIVSGYVPYANMPIGSVVQVVSAVTNTTTSNSSGTAVAATNLSVTITPKSATNKIFIMASVPATASNGNGNYYFARNTSVIGATEKFLSAGGTGTQFAISLSYLDNPATTSATTYQVYFNAGSSTMYVNQNGAYSTITAMEIVA